MRSWDKLCEQLGQVADASVGLDHHSEIAGLGHGIEQFLKDCAAGSRINQ
jgi:hypothetical protein